MNSQLFRVALGQTIHAERKAHNLTLNMLSESALVSTSYLSELEFGMKDASSEIIDSICLGLQIPLDTLLLKVTNRLAIARSVDGLEIFANEHKDTEALSPELTPVI